MILSVEHIKKSYPTGDGLLTVLRDVSLSLEEGQLVSIMGPSGCGKSTLLNVLGTLDRPDSGKLWIDGHDALSLTDDKLSNLRRTTIGFVFQFHHLLAEFTVLENLMIPQMMAGVNVHEASRKGIDLLKRVQLDRRKNHKPNAISGGERQRVAVLRALVNSPKIVLADEPTGNLDIDTGRHLMEMMKELVQVQGSSFLVVSHNPDAAAECERNLTLGDGVMHEGGKKVG